MVPGRQAPTKEEAPPAEASPVGSPWGQQYRLLAEPPRPAAVREDPRAPWFAVATVCVGAFMGQLDASIVTLAFPDLQRSFHATLGSVTWAGLSYLLVLVALVTAVGRLADMVGRKLLYIYGFAVFIVGSALCGLAPSLPALDAFRVLQAVGAAMLQANSVAIIALAVRRQDLGRAIGYQGAAQALGLALGPTVGGLLVALGGWRLIFWVNVPFGLVGMVAGWLLIPRSRHLAPWRGWRGLDWWGLGLFVPAIGCLLAAVSLGDTLGWTSPAIVSQLVVAVALGTAFVVYERRAEHPLVEVNLFRRRSFASAIASGMLSFLVLFGVLLVVPFYLERGFSLGSGIAGVELMAMPVALGLTAPQAGRLADRIGSRPLTVAGMTIASATLVAVGLTRPGGGLLALALAAVGLGLGLFTPPNNAAIMGSAPKSSSGVVSGILNMTRGVGTALGLAVTTLVFEGAGGSGHHPATVRAAFGRAALMLAAVALGAAILAAARGPAAVGRRQPFSLE